METGGGFQEELGMVVSARHGKRDIAVGTGGGQLWWGGILSGRTCAILLRAIGRRKLGDEFAEVWQYADTVHDTVISSVAIEDW